MVVNFAAETHVDNSIEGPSVFAKTNVLGTQVLLDAARRCNVSRFLHVSTDEVYGSLDNSSRSSIETDKLDPRSPYSASKAAAEHLVKAYFETYNLPILITRSSNNYGPYQFPEKLLPKFITNLIEGKKVPLMWSEDNPGLNVRDWLHVEDNCLAIYLVLTRGVLGEIYNIAGGCEQTNYSITKFLLSQFNAGEEMIEKVPHRKGHDFRYSIDCSKLKRLGFEHKYKDLASGLKQTIEWYKHNQSWWRPLKMNGLIFGNGYMGSRIKDEFGYKLSNFRITDMDSLGAYLDAEKPDIVINAVGKTGRPNIDWCETHKEETLFSNLVVSTLLAIACSKRGIYMVHIGSGCIYEGDNCGKGFIEEDEPNFYGPQFYAKTKILSEKVLCEFNCLQIRIRMPLDDHSHERNLIDKLLKYPKVIDVQNSITTVPHLLTAMRVLIGKKATGVFNVTNPGTISAAEVLNLYKEIVNPSHKFEIFSLEELDKITLGKRSNCKLDSSKLECEGAYLPEVHDAVRECLIKYKAYSE